MAFQTSKSLKCSQLSPVPFMNPFQQHQAVSLMSDPDRSPKRKKLYSSLDRHLDMIQRFYISEIMRETKPQKASINSGLKKKGNYDHAENNIPL